jgi:lysophospholipase L1-like esterase
MTAALKHLMAALVAAFLCACGGGGSSEPPARAPAIVAIWGDSIPSGTYALPDGSVGRHSPSPVQRINELAAGRFVARDHAIPGMTTRNALQGGFSWQGSAPSQPFAEFVRSTDASVIVLRYGTADALWLVTPDEFRDNLRELVRVGQDAGKRVVLVEPINQGAGVIYADPMAVIVKDIAQERGALFIPVRDLPAVLIDGIHPDQATADRLAARITEHLLVLISSKEAGNA